MRQVLTGWGVAVRRKILTGFTIYFPRPLLPYEDISEVESLLFIKAPFLLGIGPYLMSDRVVHFRRCFLLGKTKNSIRDTRMLVFAGLLVAVQIVLSRLLAIDMAWCRLSFGPVSPILAGLWFGPAVGGICGALGDFLGCLLRYGYQPAYIPITIGIALWGVIPALFRPLMVGSTRRRVLFLCIAVFLSSVIGTLGLSTLGNSILYGTAFSAMFMTRLPQWCLTMPLYCLVSCLLYFSPLTGVVRSIVYQGAPGPAKN